MPQANGYKLKYLVCVCVCIVHVCVVLTTGVSNNEIFHEFSCFDTVNNIVISFQSYVQIIIILRIQFTPTD